MGFDGRYKYFYSYSAGIDFSRQNLMSTLTARGHLTSTDVRFARAVRVKHILFEMTIDDGVHGDKCMIVSTALSQIHLD